MARRGRPQHGDGMIPAARGDDLRAVREAQDPVVGAADPEGTGRLEEFQLEANLALDEL